MRVERSQTCSIGSENDIFRLERFWELKLMPTPTWSCLNQLSTPPIPEILLDLWLGLFTVGSVLQPI